MPGRALVHTPWGSRHGDVVSSQSMFLGVSEDISRTGCLVYSFGNGWRAVPSTWAPSHGHHSLLASAVEEDFKMMPAQRCFVGWAGSLVPASFFLDSF